MAKIYAPNKQYSGVSASVPFANGVGETNIPHLIEWFKGHGYTVKEVEQELKNDHQEQEESEISEDDKSQVQLCKGELETLKKHQLQEIAKLLELEFTDRTTCEQLIEMIKIAKDMEE